MSGFILFGLVSQSFKVLQASFKGRDPGNRHFSALAPSVWVAGLLVGSLPAIAKGDDAPRLTQNLYTSGRAHDDVAQAMVRALGGRATLAASEALVPTITRCMTTACTVSGSDQVVGRCSAIYGGRSNAPFWIAGVQ